MRKLKSIVVINFLCLLLLVGCSKQQPAPPTPATPQTPQTSQGSIQKPSTTNPPTTTAPTTTQVSGSDLYSANCAGCHGINGAGGASGPAINTDEWKNNSPKVQAIIKKGQNAMPPFSGKLTDTQVKAIGDYVASLKK